MKTIVKIGIGIGIAAGVGLVIDSVCDIIANKVMTKMANAVEVKSLPDEDDKPLEADEIN